MKRSRVLLICLLLLLLMVPVAWKIAVSNHPSSRASGNASSAPIGSEVPSTDRSDEGKTSRRPVDYAAKAKSMLELRHGELGILPIPSNITGADIMPGTPAGGEGSPQFRGMVHKEIARQLLEKALRGGAAIQAKVGPGGDGIDWKSEKLGLNARLGDPNAGFPELLVEASENGETTSKMSVQIAAGTCAMVRYPSGETVLVVVGGSLPVGGLIKEQR